MNNIKTIISLLLIFQYGVCWSWRYHNAYHPYDCPKGTHFIEESTNHQSSYGDIGYGSGPFGHNSFNSFSFGSNRYGGMFRSYRGYCQPNSVDCYRYNQKKMSCEECDDQYQLVWSHLTGDFCEIRWYWALFYFLMIVCLVGGVFLCCIGCCAKINRDQRGQQAGQHQQNANPTTFDNPANPGRYGYGNLDHLNQNPI